MNKALLRDNAYCVIDFNFVFLGTLNLKLGTLEDFAIMRPVCQRRKCRN